MNLLLDNPPVTAEILEEAVRRILAAGSPLKIVLFGSRARGEAGPGSDLDLLIVEESHLPRYKRAARYLRALVGVFPAKDVVVWTPEEIEAWSRVPNAFVTTALREGKTLYAR
ncbi:MAG TPA: nucleotidyltransferase domain-containing protein [Terriglobia bacterium]|nr:nucleotidyltransferase domain-containing protein [Terriglobia bacterium]